MGRRRKGGQCAWRHRAFSESLRKEHSLSRWVHRLRREGAWALDSLQRHRCGRVHGFHPSWLPGVLSINPPPPHPLQMNWFDVPAGLPFAITRVWTNTMCSVNSHDLVTWILSKRQGKAEKERSSQGHEAREGTAELRRFCLVI